MTPHTLAEAIPTVCTVADVCRILQVSESQFYVLRRKGAFPIPAIDPPIDSRPRFLGAHVQAYISGETAPRWGRKRRA